MDQELRFRMQQSPPQDPHNDAEFQPPGHAPQQYGGPQFGQQYPAQGYGHSGFPPGYDQNAGYGPGYGMTPSGYPQGQGGGGMGAPSGAFPMGDNFGNTVMMNYGMQYGSKMLQKTQANFGRYFSLQGLHYYFTVNNSYVKVILLPSLSLPISVRLHYTEKWVLFLLLPFLFFFSCFLSVRLSAPNPQHRTGQAAFSLSLVFCWRLSLFRTS